MSGYPKFPSSPECTPSPQVCIPPPKPPPPCVEKPNMRRLHLAQTKRTLVQAFAIVSLSGLCVYIFLGRARRERYRIFYETGEFGEWEDEMARKGLFQSVPLSEQPVNK